MQDKQDKVSLRVELPVELNIKFKDACKRQMPRVAMKNMAVKLIKDFVDSNKGAR